MAEATELTNFPRESTLQEVLEVLERIAALKAAEVSASLDPDTLTLEQIRSIVRLGYADKVFEIGQKIAVPYTYNGSEYEFIWDIVHFDNVELEDGETVPGMFLQAHYATPESLMFDSYEAFYIAEDGLEAGTYNITAGYSSNSLTSGTSYQFTLTEDVPAGGVLAGFRLAGSSSVTDISTLYVYSYESQNSGYSDYIEAVAISEGSDGTNLGTFYISSEAADSGLNHGHRFQYGYNRWSQSAYRQWLNSDAAAGAWWEAQNDYDLPPQQSASYPGFKAGFEEDFLNVLKKIKVTTALNTVEGLTDTSEDTYDMFFLPSLEQIYVVPQLSDVEGDYWEYWKRVTGAASPQAQYGTYPLRITYGLDAKSSACGVRLRSAVRGGAYYTWCVSSVGYVGNGYACNTYRCAPACVIA